ncbi:MAG: phosphatidate cytidylyltransferase [Bacillota bacterium]
MIITRVIVGVLAALLLLFSLFFSEWTFYLVLIGASFLSLWEIYAALKRAGFNPLRWTGLVFALLFVPLGYFAGMDGVIALYAMLGFAAMAHRLFHPECTLQDIFSSIFSLFYAGLPFIMIFFTVRLQPASYGFIAVLTAVACPLNSDVFAFFTGTVFGRAKLSPEISPNKTIEGSAGGVAGSIIAGLILWLWVQKIWGLSIGVEHFIILGILCSVTAQMGDLVASSIKRMAGIKDFGNIFPAHGGMLDRIDSILFTVPVAYVYYKYIIIG